MTKLQILQSIVGGVEFAVSFTRGIGYQFQSTEGAYFSVWARNYHDALCYIALVHAGACAVSTTMARKDWMYIDYIDFGWWVARQELTDYREIERRENIKIEQAMKAEVTELFTPLAEGAPIVVEWATPVGINVTIGNGETMFFTSSYRASEFAREWAETGARGHMIPDKEWYTATAQSRVIEDMRARIKEDLRTRIKLNSAIGYRGTRFEDAAEWEPTKGTLFRWDGE